MSTTPIKYKSAKSKTKSGRVVKRSSKIKNKRDDDITIANNGGGSGSSKSNKFVKLLNNRLSKIEDLIANLNQTINNNNNNKSSLTENSNEISNLSLEQLQTLVSELRF
ncbi:21422_t:CDS:2 [Entrophospora sp. SA101]|nr:21422_t:CDS:2 [Entrophospora sp. SA101]